MDQSQKPDDGQKNSSEKTGSHRPLDKYLEDQNKPHQIQQHPDDVEDRHQTPSQLPSREMARLFSSSEYIDIVSVYGEASGVLLKSREFPCYFLWGYMKDLVYSIPIVTIEVLRKRV
jgi:hypothetical protein